MDCNKMTPETRLMLGKKFEHLFQKKETKMKGYLYITDEEADLMNEGKELAEKCVEFVDRLESLDGLDQRFISIGKTDLQTGFMALIRGIAKPITF